MRRLLMRTIRATIGKAVIPVLVFDVMDTLRWERRYAIYRKKYNIDPSFQFNGPGIIFYGEGNITCGRDSYMGRFGSIQASEGCKVTIGHNVAISHFVMIYTQNKEAGQDLSLPQSQIKKRMGDVTIGDHCWIGAQVFIREGVSIGNNSVIGAGSVVTSSIPPNCIAGGVPATVMKHK